MNKQQATEWRRQRAEAAWRERFENLGLSEWFDLIRRDWDSDKGKRVIIKCRTCGAECDLNDHSWTKYIGPTYPSIDHIVPMSKGGGHVWGNVQVAHIICNSEKGDKIGKVV